MRENLGSLGTTPFVHSSSGNEIELGSMISYRNIQNGMIMIKENLPKGVLHPRPVFFFFLSVYAFFSKTTTR